MLTPYNFFLKEILFPASAIFFFIGSIAAVLIGVGLILHKASMFRLFAFMNRWVSTRQALKFAEVPRNVDSVLRKRLWLLGAIVVVGALVAVYGLVNVSEVAIVREIVSKYVPQVTAQVLAESAKWLLLVGNVFAVLIGITMLFFPRTLAKLEEGANKWVSVRQHTRGADNMHMVLDNVVAAYPRISGCIILGMGVFLALNLSVVLFGRH